MRLGIHLVFFVIRRCTKASAAAGEVVKSLDEEIEALVGSIDSLEENGATVLVTDNDVTPAVTVLPPEGASPDAKDAAVSKYRGLLVKYTDKLTALCSGKNCVHHIFRQPGKI